MIFLSCNKEISVFPFCAFGFFERIDMLRVKNVYKKDGNCLDYFPWLTSCIICVNIKFSFRFKYS